MRKITSSEPSIITCDVSILLHIQIGAEGKLTDAKKQTNKQNMGKGNRRDRKKPKTANFIAEHRPWKEAGPRFLRGKIRVEIRSVILGWRRYGPQPQVEDTSGYCGVHHSPQKKVQKTAPVAWIL